MKDYFESASGLVESEYNYEAYLQSIGYVLHENDLGFAHRENLPHRAEDRFNDVLTEMARLMSDTNQEYLEMFTNFSQCYPPVKKSFGSERPLYRPIDNYGNNLIKPYWGNPKTPYKRFGEKTYDDGIRSVRKSVTGVTLPSPRKILIDVLDKGEYR